MRLMTFSPDDTLAIMTSNGILLYNVESRSFVSTLSFLRSTAMAFSPYSTHLAAGNSDSTVYLWDIRGIEASSPSSNKQAGGEVTALALFRDYSRVACGFEYGAVELWETGSLANQPIAAHTHHSKEVTTLGCSPDGWRFASGSNDWDCHLMGW
ncbi:hypothetical protein M378DRAFT_591462 [Amanita muscaria Koide BX008]|uniref:Uncharacterized protein n=1 Tax=Amanita muscaria (strain Koide BX008) TaxID=946122 RepID=A0A0C2WFW7_AMAMK|nr:hypothetical protein M378DRAFT_591462 [Amanita muscaria Koide BX008]